MRFRLLLAFFAMLAAAACMNAQGPGGHDGDRDHHGPDGPPPPMQRNRNPMDRAMHIGPHGKWWSDTKLAQRLGLTDDQKKKMDDVFDQNRLKLIDLSGNLQKQEALLDPLLVADRPEEVKVLAQIDRVAQARAELEKGNARMLLGIRSLMTQDQWTRLRAENPEPPPRR